MCAYFNKNKRFIRFIGIEIFIAAKACGHDQFINNLMKNIPSLITVYNQHPDNISEKKITFYPSIQKKYIYDFKLTLRYYQLPPSVPI